MMQLIEIEKIISGEDNMKDFQRFLKEFGIEDVFEDITLNHIKDRLEALLAIAEEGNDPKISSKKKELKRLLENLKGEKDKRAAMRALREIYSAYNSSDLDEKELDRKLKHSLKEVKKYEHFKKHEEEIARKWIRNLNKKGNKIEEV
ncbi:MAG: hypothetical protein KIB43_05410 [Clostridium baratii]|uniref:Uncharacterized protein n=1 Tax=Clostridium baratii str. Sullivan TaxID=1415775 RepID=A0A0A7FXE4_9CLOT|nr:hypothetical protein [Clostridium baratii]AIY84267.1 hypothetical protein U729_110 [Clostridium baratii str. Sullivan]MBS6006378.1 hypothetical protein [Clostridium baratii]MDU1053952.1 hypothetical protein [Clostridium baratii]MDU4910855.1 hypothetical protein [Clostridium baratii]